MRIAPLTTADLDVVDRELPLNRLDQHRRGGSTYLVAWEGRRPVGHGLIAWPAPELEDPTVPELQDVYVAPERRRQGIGAALTAAAEREAAHRGFDRLMVAVATDNTDARRLYERAGYVDAGFAPQRVHGSITIRGKPVFVDATLLYLVKRL